MTLCSKCHAEMAENWLVCPFCGRPIDYTPTKKKRGNGQGTIFKLKNGKYKAVVTLGYYHVEGEKNLRRKTKSKVFEKKSDAVKAIKELMEQKDEVKRCTFQQLYDKWQPTHKAGKDTMNCYKAAYKYFKPLYPMQISDIEIDDLQECLDDCPHGKRTKQNMKALAGLMYKYAIPRQLTNLNLAEYLKVDGDSAAHRSSFNDIQLEQIKKACGVVPHADLIYILIYLGFRPSEFLDLTVADYDKKNGIIVGGAKTEAGKGRIVPVSSKIKPMLDAIVPEQGYLIPLDNRVDRLKVFTNEMFYPALEKIGIENPIVEIAGGKTRHKYTPHSCRHTFATLMKRVNGSDKDKQELIGHASAEMLRYYQDVELNDLKAIIEAI